MTKITIHSPQQTKTISVGTAGVCIVILVIFYPTATLNLLTMLLDKYAKSVYVPSKDVYFVALYNYYGKFTEMTPFEKKYALYFFWRALYQTCHVLAISH